MKKHLKVVLYFLAVAVSTVAMISSSATASAAEYEDRQWISAWGTAPTEMNISGMGAVGSLVGDITVRVVINPTASGEKFRIKLSNYYGNEPLRIKGITAAKSVLKKDGTRNDKRLENIFKILSIENE